MATPATLEYADGDTKTIDDLFDFALDLLGEGLGGRLIDASDYAIAAAIMTTDPDIVSVTLGVEDLDDLETIENNGDLYDDSDFSEDYAYPW